LSQIHCIDTAAQTSFWQGKSISDTGFSFDRKQVLLGNVPARYVGRFGNG